MHELLNVVIDFNSEMVARIDLQTLLGSIMRFLNCYRMQSGLNNFRIYVAFNHYSYLLFPMESATNEASDTQLI